MKLVVLEGAGDTVDKHYYQALEPWVDKKQIKLWATDVVNKPWAFDQDRNPKAKHRVNEKGTPHKLVFLCKDNKKDKRTWQYLTADDILIVTPDKYHCEAAAKWLNTANRIIVDKSFAPGVKDIEQHLPLKNALVQKKVWGFDHYRIKALPIRSHLRELVNRIGGELVKVEFRMLENRRVEWYRRDLPGMLEDFGSHLPALLELIVGDGLEQVKIQKVWRAQHLHAWPPEDTEADEKETFAEIEFVFDTVFSTQSVHGRALLGKGVGYVDEKFLELTGLNSDLKIRLDLRGGRIPIDIVVYRRVGQRFIPHERVGYLINNPHRELINRVILDTIDVEECLLNVRGVYQVVNKVQEMYECAHKTHQQAGIELLAKYEVGDDIDTVLSKTKKDRRSKWAVKKMKLI